MLALDIYRRGVCACGFHESLTEDRANHFTFDQRTCPVCRGVAKMARLQAHEDEQAEKALGQNPAPGIPRLADGRRTFVRMMSPLEVAALSARKSAPDGN